MSSSEKVLVNQLGTGSRGSVALFLWGLLRFPAILIVFYLLRNQILSVIEITVGYGGVTEYAIALISTPLSRLVILVLIVAVLWVVWWLAQRQFSPVLAYVSTIVAAGVLLFTIFRLTDSGLSRLLPTMLILATNLLPDQIIERVSQGGRWWNRFMAVGIGVAELFFIRRYMNWLYSLWKSWQSGSIPALSKLRGWLALPSFVVTGVLVVGLLNFEPLVPLEQAIRMPPEVSIIDSGDMNWIEIDRSGQYLFASGHGLQHLLRYDLSDPTAEPLWSNVPVGGAQGFAYDPDTAEIYVYNTETQTLLYLDASTLELTRSLALPEVSPGDPWIAVDSHTDTLTIVSEADVRTGSPLVVLNRSSGEIVDQRDLAASSILMNLDKPILYLSFSRYDTNLVAYDLEQRDVTLQVATDPRVDRMIIWEQANELLLASPLESSVLRFDADTLQFKGTLAANFGVRVLAVDPLRNILLCGSLTTGTVAVFDLATGQQTASYYLGPWLRTIALDSDRGTAYVSANGTLYGIQYGRSI